MTLLTATPDVLIAHAGRGIDILEELIAYAKSHPGELRYSYIAPRSIHRAEFSALLNELGIDATLDESVRGSAPAMSAVAEGALDLVITTDESVVQQINALGMEVSLSDSPAAFDAYIEAEGERLLNAADKYQIVVD